MQITIQYGEKPCGYEGIELKLSGDIDSLANWIDEHLIAARCQRGGIPYEQGANSPSIKQWLQNGGTYDGLDDCTLVVC